MHQPTDPLLDVWARLGRALAPFGIRVEALTLPLWREMQAHGAGPFTESGEFDPAAVQKLAAVVALMQASAADPQDGAHGTE